MRYVAIVSFRSDKPLPWERSVMNELAHEWVLKMRIAVKMSIRTLSEARRLR